MNPGGSLYKSNAFQNPTYHPFPILSTPFQMREDLRSKCDRFRVLIIGNANAGKTTILQKVCNANGRQHEVFDSAGQKVRITLQTSLRLHSELVSAQTDSTVNPSNDVRCLDCTLDP